MTTSIEINAIQTLDDGCPIVVFREHETRGMVGESHFWTTAHAVYIERGTIVELSYEDLRKMYKHVHSKDLRIRFWRLMKSMSPEAEALEGYRSYKEAISKVI